MPLRMTDKPKESERSLTDESLRTERDNTDRVLAESKSAIEEDADEIVRRAREDADAVLDEARDKADEHLARDGARLSIVDTVAEERASADEVLCDERAAEDDVIRRRREDEARVLLSLLPHERAKTDRHLLSERIRSDDALANRDDFLSVVSHDLRNLLSNIVMSLSLLDGEADPEVHGGIRAHTDRIRRYAGRMSRLIGDLEDVSSIETGHLAIERARGDMPLVATEALETFQGAASARNITLASEHLEEPLIADFDEGRVLQVLDACFAVSGCGGVLTTPWCLDRP